VRRKGKTSAAAGVRRYVLRPFWMSFVNDDFVPPIPEPQPNVLEESPIETERFRKVRSSLRLLIWEMLRNAETVPKSTAMQAST